MNNKLLIVLAFVVGAAIMYSINNATAIIPIKVDRTFDSKDYSTLNKKMLLDYQTVLIKASDGLDYYYVMPKGLADLLESKIAVTP